MPALKPSVLLTRALVLFGPRGQRWCQHTMRIPKDREYKGKSYPNGAYCSLGALTKINTSNRPKAQEFLRQAIQKQRGYHDGNIILYNDAPSRTFSGIRAVFRRAIALAKAAGQ